MNCIRCGRPLKALDNAKAVQTADGVVYWGPKCYSKSFYTKKKQRKKKEKIFIDEFTIDMFL